MYFLHLKDHFLSHLVSVIVPAIRSGHNDDPVLPIVWLLGRESTHYQPQTQGENWNCHSLCDHLCNLLTTEMENKPEKNTMCGFKMLKVVNFPKKAKAFAKPHKTLNVMTFILIIFIMKMFNLYFFYINIFTIYTMYLLWNYTKPLKLQYVHFKI